LLQKGQKNTYQSAIFHQVAIGFFIGAVVMTAEGEGEGETKRPPAPADATMTGPGAGLGLAGDEP
jgi:hypothetical protein